MAIFRAEKTKDYTVMANAHLRDTRISLKAKGLLSVILSLPDDWDFSVTGLVTICKEKASAVRASLSELEMNGYLMRTKTQSEHGQFSYSYDIYEEPHTEEPHAEGPHTEEPHTEEPHTEEPHTEEPHTEEPYTEEPHAEEPYTEEPYTENRTQLNTNILSTYKQNTYKPNTEYRGRRKGFAPPTAKEVHAYCLEEKLDTDADGFVDFYSAKGWKVGNTPMADWKAAVRNWARRDKQQSLRRAPVPKKPFDQRDYEAEGYRDWVVLSDIMHRPRAGGS